MACFNTIFGLLCSCILAIPIIPWGRTCGFMPNRQDPVTVPSSSSTSEAKGPEHRTDDNPLRTHPKTRQQGHRCVPNGVKMQDTYPPLGVGCASEVARSAACFADPGAGSPHRCQTSTSTNCLTRGEVGNLETHGTSAGAAKTLGVPIPSWDFNRGVLLGRKLWRERPQTEVNCDDF